MDLTKLASVPGADATWAAGHLATLCQDFPLLGKVSHVIAGVSTAAGLVASARVAWQACPPAYQGLMRTELEKYPEIFGVRLWRPRRSMSGRLPWRPWYQAATRPYALLPTSPQPPPCLHVPTPQVKEEPIPLGKNERSAPPRTKENRDEALRAARDRSTRDQSHRDQENEGEGRDWTKRDRTKENEAARLLILEQRFLLLVLRARQADLEDCIHTRWDERHGHL